MPERWSGESSDLFQETLADPANHGDRLAVADGLVARAVRAILGRLAAPGDQRVVVCHSLEAFALPGDEAPNRTCFGHNVGAQG